MEKEKYNVTPEVEVAPNTGSTGAEIVEEQQTYKEMSPIQLIFRRFFRSKLSIVGLLMIVFLFAFSFLGPVIYTRVNEWGEATVDRGEFVEQHFDEYKIIGDNGEEIIMCLYVCDGENIYYIATEQTSAAETIVIDVKE
jgi:hypothetical protein